VPTTELVLVFARSDRTTSSTALNVGVAWVSGIVWHTTPLSPTTGQPWVSASIGDPKVNNRSSAPQA
jgi:hypothetical protein